MVKTTDCGSVMRGFESHYPPIKIPITFVIGIFICVCEDENPLKCEAFVVYFFTSDEINA